MNESNSTKDSFQTKLLNKLSEEEALLLSEHLKHHRNSGIPLYSDQKSINKWAPGKQKLVPG